MKQGERDTLDNCRGGALFPRRPPPPPPSLNYASTEKKERKKKAIPLVRSWKEYIARTRLHRGLG